MSSEQTKKNIDISNVDVFILINNVTDDLKEICPGSSKSFLKVLNKRLLFYQLEFFERQGIKKVNLILSGDIILVTDLYLKEYKGVQINKIPFDSDKDIYYLFSKIKEHSTKNNFIIVDGDSLFSFDLFEFIDNHIDNRNLISMILQKKNLKELKLSFLKREKIDIFGIGSEDNRVLFYAQKEKESDNNEKLRVPKNILQHCPNIKLLFNYIDGGFYIINKSIFDIIDNEYFKKDRENMKTFNNELFPYLIKKSFSKNLNMILINKLAGLKDKDKFSLLAKRITIKAKIIDNIRNDNLSNDYYCKIIDYPTYLSTIEEIQTPYEKILPMFFQTENNDKNYFMNFIKKIGDNLNNGKAFNDGIEQLECFTADSYVAVGENIESLKIEKGSRVIRSVTGVDLNLNEGAKITSCLIGDGVEIGKDCKITNCVVGEGVVIKEGCVISDCVIQKGCKIEEVINTTQTILRKKKNDEDLFK